MKWSLASSYENQTMWHHKAILEKYMFVAAVFQDVFKKAKNCGAAVIFILGIIDDKRQAAELHFLNWAWKLLSQFGTGSTSSHKIWTGIHSESHFPPLTKQVVLY